MNRKAVKHRDEKYVGEGCRGIIWNTAEDRWTNFSIYRVAQRHLVIKMASTSGVLVVSYGGVPISQEALPTLVPGWLDPPQTWS